MSQDRITALEERIAHLGRSVEDLSDVITRQEKELALLTHRLQLLLEREAGRDTEIVGTMAPADQKPPHW